MEKNEWRGHKRGGLEAQYCCSGHLTAIGSLILVVAPGDMEKIRILENRARKEARDDAPPDELNRAPVKGLHFGFPFCHGGVLADPDYGSDQACRQFTPPVAPLHAHAAPLGMRFYTGRMFPRHFMNQIFIAA